MLIRSFRSAITEMLEKKEFNYSLLAGGEEKREDITVVKKTEEGGWLLYTCKVCQVEVRHAGKYMQTVIIENKIIC
jgi:hypothetical protein